MEDWAEMMYSEIEITDMQNGWFKKIQNCARGHNILVWVEHKVSEDKKKALQVCQRLMDKKLITCTDPLVTKFDPEFSYEFYFNGIHVADNLHKTWESAVSDALKVSLKLIEICQELLNVGLTPDKHKEIHYLDVEAALKSSEFKTYKNEVC